MNVHWPLAAAKFTRTCLEHDTGKLHGYRLQKNAEGLSSSFMVSILSAALQGQKEAALASLAKGKNFQIDFYRAIEAATADIRELYARPLNELAQNSQVTEITLKTGMSAQEQREACTKMYAFARQKFKTFQRVIQKEQELDALKPIIYGAYGDYYVSEGAIVRNIALPATSSPYPISALSCVAFALLYLNDRDFLANWNRNPCPEEMLKQKYHAYLLKLNYRQVTHPVADDLVVYVNNQTTEDLRGMMHLGIFLDNGKVLSKKGGINDPNIYEHEIDRVPANYGNLILFYRKNRATY